jgi:hypothetical protein
MFPSISDINAHIAKQVESYVEVETDHLELDEIKEMLDEDNDKRIEMEEQVLNSTFKFRCEVYPYNTLSESMEDPIATIPIHNTVTKSMKNIDWSKCPIATLSILMEKLVNEYGHDVKFTVRCEPDGDSHLDGMIDIINLYGHEYAKTLVESELQAVIMQRETSEL